MSQSEPLPASQVPELCATIQESVVDVYKKMHGYSRERFLHGHGSRRGFRGLKPDCVKFFNGLLPSLD